MQLIIMRRDIGVHLRGDVIEVRATSTPFSPTVNFVMAEAADAVIADWDSFGGPWDRILDFEVVAHNSTLDGYRIRLFSETANAGNGLITLSEVQAFILSWGGTVVSSGANEVVFDILVYDALASAAFFEINTSIVNFNEVGYDVGTGVHTIEADYSALGNNPTYVERYLISELTSVVAHANKVITYEADRSFARNKFQDDIRAKSQKIIERRRYYLGEGVVSAIESAGGVFNTDSATLAGYLKDKAVD